MNYEETVASQPGALEHSAARVREQLASAKLDPWRHGSVGVVAMGASTHAAHGLVDRFVRHGRPAFNLNASDVMALGGRVVLADSYVLISEGGRSRETVEAVASLPAGGRLGLTNARESPFASAVDLAVDLAHGEDSRVYTIGYTATLQAFSLLATAIDGADDGEDLPALPGEIEQVLSSAPAYAEEVAERIDGLGSLDFVGHGSSLATAAEGALLFREATRTATAAFETFQYLHGPMEAQDDQRGAVVIGSGRELALAEFLAAQRIFTVLVSADDVKGGDFLTVIRIPERPPLVRCILEILPLQVIAGVLARRRGLGIDGFRYTQSDTKLPS